MVPKEGDLANRGGWTTYRGLSSCTPDVAGVAGGPSDVAGVASGPTGTFAVAAPANVAAARARPGAGAGAVVWPVARTRVGTISGVRRHGHHLWRGWMGMGRVTQKGAATGRWAREPRRLGRDWSGLELEGRWRVGDQATTRRRLGHLGTGPTQVGPTRTPPVIDWIGRHLAQGLENPRRSPPPAVRVATPRGPHVMHSRKPPPSDLCTSCHGKGLINFFWGIFASGIIYHSTPTH